MNPDDFKKLIGTDKITQNELNERSPYIKLILPLADFHKFVIEKRDRERGKKELASAVTGLITFATKDIDEAMEVFREVEKLIQFCDKKINK